MEINIVMVEPEIPQNTGNIARSCAATGAKLHLVHPLGFDISEKQVKRAGLDYWDKVNIEEHESLEAFMNKYKEFKNDMFFYTTKGKHVYSDVKYEEHDKVFLLFGKETKGLPEDLILSHFDHACRIPMRKTLRSLNLSNSVAIVLYEVLRHIDFEGLQEESNYFDN